METINKAKHAKSSAQNASKLLTMLKVNLFPKGLFALFGQFRFFVFGNCYLFVWWDGFVIYSSVSKVFGEK